MAPFLKIPVECAMKMYYRCQNEQVPTLEELLLTRGFPEPLRTKLMNDFRKINGSPKTPIK